MLFGEAVLTMILAAIFTYVAWENATAEPSLASASDDSRTTIASAGGSPSRLPFPSTIPADPPPALKPSTVAREGRGTIARDGMLTIPSIGVRMPIVEGRDERALYRGAWRSPFGSTPDRGGNTVLFGHRYLHLPPHPETFYALDRLGRGDTVKVRWNGKTYTYAVVERRVVDPHDVSVLGNTATPSLTLITCTPVFTTRQRLVVRAELVSEGVE
jgi:sortase A